MKLLVALLIVCFSFTAEARSTSGSHVRLHYLRPSSCYSCGHRSLEAKHEFKRSNPCPSIGKPSGACPGYVIDHVQALKHGGADAPSNMQWQTTSAAKGKDKVE